MSMTDQRVSERSQPAQSSRWTGPRRYHTVFSQQFYTDMEATSNKQRPPPKGSGKSRAEIVSQLYQTSRTYGSHCTLRSCSNHHRQSMFKDTFLFFSLFLLSLHERIPLQGVWPNTKKKKLRYHRMPRQSDFSSTALHQSAKISPTDNPIIQ